MKNITATRLLIPLLAAAVTGTASAAIHMDGALPMYPNAVPRGFTGSTPSIDKALKIGFTLIEDTADSVNTAAAWYEANLPKSCAKSSNGVAVAFRCSADSFVAVRTTKGKTFIVVSPETKIPTAR